MSQNLTTLERVRSWLNKTAADTAGDAFLRDLIASASTFVLSYVDRSTFAAEEITDVYDTFGNAFLVLREAPVLSVQSVGFYGQTIEPAVGSPRGPGYLLERAGSPGSQQRLTLFGHSFPNARGETSVTYTAGYMATEQKTIPASPGPYTVETAGMWVSAISVVAFDGTPFVQVGSAPGPGQYRVSEAGIYTFNAANEDETVSITFGTVPADVVQAVTELVGEAFKRKDRIGQSSQSLAGKESVSYFSQRDMNATIRTMLNPYKRVTPA